MSATKSVRVQVMAVGGKFVGDDIGGASITIRDADTKEILAQGVTTGDSGANGKGGVMDACIKRGQCVPFTDTTSSFSADVPLHSARRIEVSAFGPLGARGSANTSSMTTWIYPDRPITTGNGILLELSGLICQIINPPTHTTNFTFPCTVQIVTNIAMMCGCPISEKKPGTIVPGDIQPWLPNDFEVTATITPCTEGAIPIGAIPLEYDTSSQGNIAGRFVTYVVDLAPGTYQLTVVAQQKSTGNTGVDVSTFVVQKAAS